MKLTLKDVKIDVADIDESIARLLINREKLDLLYDININHANRKLEILIPYWEEDLSYLNGLLTPLLLMVLVANYEVEVISILTSIIS